PRIAPRARRVPPARGGSATRLPPSRTREMNALRIAIGVVLAVLLLGAAELGVRLVSTEPAEWPPPPDSYQLPGRRNDPLLRLLGSLADRVHGRRRRARVPRLGRAASGPSRCACRVPRRLLHVRMGHGHSRYVRGAPRRTPAGGRGRGDRVHQRGLPGAERG